MSDENVSMTAIKLENLVDVLRKSGLQQNIRNVCRTSSHLSQCPDVNHKFSQCDGDIRDVLQKSTVSEKEVVRCLIFSAD